MHAYMSTAGKVCSLAVPQLNQILSYLDNISAIFPKQFRSKGQVNHGANK